MLKNVPASYVIPTEGTLGTLGGGNEMVFLG